MGSAQENAASLHSLQMSTSIKDGLCLYREEHQERNLDKGSDREIGWELLEQGQEKEQVLGHEQGKEHEYEYEQVKEHEQVKEGEQQHKLMLLHITEASLVAAEQRTLPPATECFTLLLAASGGYSCVVAGVDYAKERERAGELEPAELLREAVQQWTLAQDDVLLLASGSAAQLQAGQEGLRLLLIAFRLHDPALHEQQSRICLSRRFQLAPAPSVPCAMSIGARDIVALAERLRSYRAPSAGTDYLQLQTELLQVVQSLLRAQGSAVGACGLLRQPSGADPCCDSLQLVQRTVQFIHRHYDQALTVKQLAALAHLEKRQYTRLFARLTGKTPLEYLTDCRLNRAKERLLLSEEQLSSIAVQTGYRDEYYFNRRFKELCGVTPRKYSRRSSAASGRICAMEFVGELLALGLRPIAAPRSALMTYAGAGGVAGIAELADHSDSCLAQLERLQPDVIIAADFIDGQLAEQLSQLAPIIMLRWDRHPLDRLEALAESLGRQQQAQQWLMQYRRKQQRLRQIVDTAFPRKRRAAVIGLDKQGLWLFAPRFFPTFYETLGFLPVSHMETTLQAQPHTRLVVLSMAQLQLLADADHIFMLYKSKERASAALGQLAATEAWHSLQAVQQGKISLLGHRWTSYDAYTLNRQLEWIKDQPELVGLPSISLSY